MRRHGINVGANIVRPRLRGKEKLLHHHKGQGDSSLSAQPNHSATDIAKVRQRTVPVVPGAAIVGKFAINTAGRTVNFVEEFIGCVNGKHLTEGAERSIMAEL